MARSADVPRRSPLWARLFLILGVVLVIVGAGTLVSVKFFIDRYTDVVSQENLLGSAADAGKSIDGPINMLLSGIDERNDDPDGGARSDSVIIVHIPATHDAAYLLSVPRDTLVHIPAFPQTNYPGGEDKINAAFEFGYQNNGGHAGGFQLLALTAQALTGISFDGGAIINFDGFRSVVRAVDGIDMCVDEEVTSVHIGWDVKTGVEGVPYRLSPPDYNDPVAIPGMRPQVYHPGCQHFSPDQALDYVRQRELIPDGDYGRQRHQQQFIKALAQKVAATGLLNLTKVDGILQAVGKTVTFDGNGVSLADWLFTLKSISPSAIITINTNGGNFHSEMVNGQSVEMLDDLSLQMFQAAKNDTLSAFVTAHPEMVSHAATPG